MFQDPLMKAALLASVLYLVLGVVFQVLARRARSGKGKGTGAPSMLFGISIFMFVLTVVFPLMCWVFLRLSSAG